MTRLYVTSLSGASHNYLDMEVSDVDTHARVWHGRVSCIQYNLTSYMMKSQSASWSKDGEFQFLIMVANVSYHAIILTLGHFDDDFAVNGEEKCSLSYTLLSNDLFPF